MTHLDLVYGDDISLYDAQNLNIFKLTYLQSTHNSQLMLYSIRCAQHFENSFRCSKYWIISKAQIKTTNGLGKPSLTAVLSLILA